MIALIVVLVVAVLVLALVLGYNGLVRRRNRTQEAWAQIDVELKRRHDLIPNLVETVIAATATDPAPDGLLPGPEPQPDDVASGPAPAAARVGPRSPG